MDRGDVLGLSLLFDLGTVALWWINFEILAGASTTLFSILTAAVFVTSIFFAANIFYGRENPARRSFNMFSGLTGRIRSAIPRMDTDEAQIVFWALLALVVIGVISFVLEPIASWAFIPVATPVYIAKHGLPER